MDQLNHCTYCDGLHPALLGDNYCSHKSGDINSISSNAFYFFTNALNSGRHVSRFTIRSITNGYQEYEIDGKSSILKNDNLLILNQGSQFENHLHQETNAEGITIAFNPNFINYYLHYINNTPEELLDNPFDNTNASLFFNQTSFPKTDKMSAIINLLMNSIKSGDKEPLYFQQLFLEILKELLQIEQNVKDQLLKLKALKSSTKVELYTRLSDAKDYIDAHLHDYLSLDIIAQKSCLSPFHFLRTFTELFDVTPYQYIKGERLKKAKFKIGNSSENLSRIMSSVGFDNNRTFQRAFQKEYGITAYQYMLSHRA